MYVQLQVDFFLQNVNIYVIMELYKEVGQAGIIEFSIFIGFNERQVYCWCQISLMARMVGSSTLMVTISLQILPVNRLLVSLRFIY